MEDDKKIILLLIIIIAILATGMAMMFSGNLFKEDCKINIKCNESLGKGDEITVRLVDANKTAIANKNLIIKINNGNHTKKYNVTTNENGKATITINDLKDGNHIINCSFKGDDKYNPTSSKKKFSFKNEASATTSSNVDPIDANRPTNDDRYKGYNPNHESEVTSDGWNPREHEVSRQTNPDGSIKIKYDDGYFRLCDENGYVITYGYGG